VVELLKACLQLSW